MRRLCILLLLAFTVCACGQKGALYLPKDKDKPEMTEEGTVKERNGKQ
jgi:predicted small lipoprotein YifL